MPRIVPLTFRQAAYAEQTGEVAVVLVKATHPDLAAPIYLSSDPTERLTLEPLVYGTRSRGKDYLFVMMSALLPSEDEDTSPAMQLLFEDVENQTAGILRSFQTPATLTLTEVLASSPDIVQGEYVDLLTVSARGDASQCTLDISREWFISEPSPAGRFTKPFFPGLHR